MAARLSTLSDAGCRCFTFDMIGIRQDTFKSIIQEGQELKIQLTATADSVMNFEEAR